jgi:hypothetical protein
MDLSAYKDLSKSPLSLSNPTDGEDDANNPASGASVFSTSLIQSVSPVPEVAQSNPNAGLSAHTTRPTVSQFGNLNDRGALPQLSNESYQELTPHSDSEFSPNVRTLIRLMSELPDGVTKQVGAQIIRLTMEAMGISMEDVLSEAQSSQSDMLDAVRANIKKIEEYKTVIRKLETDIKFYQGKANELSEIIDLFILSNSSSSSNRMGQLETMPGGQAMSGPAAYGQQG